MIKSLIVLLLALFLPVVSFAQFIKSPAYIGAAAIQGTPVAPPAGGNCAPSTNLPSADTVQGTDTGIVGGPSTMWEALDEARGSTDTTDYINMWASSSRTATTLRFTLPGNCDVTNVTVYVYSQAFGGTETLDVYVSPDNSTFTSTVTMANATTLGERNSAFTGLSWTTPTYCYVKILGNATTWGNLYIFNMQVVINP